MLVAGGMSAGTAATVSTVASVAGMAMTGLSALSSVNQGKAAGQMATYNQQVAQNEAIAARQKAEFDETTHRRQVAKLQGAQRAGIAASGGELLDAGDVMDMTTEEAELDALAIRYGGKMAQNAAQQRSTLYGLEGKQAKRQAYAQAGSTLLTGAQSGIQHMANMPKTPNPTAGTGISGWSNSSFKKHAGWNR